MRTRAQRRQQMPELAQKLQRRLRELETAATCSPSAPLSPPAPKKRKTEGGSASPLLLTPHHPKPRTPARSILKTPEKATETKFVPLRRTLQYTSPVIPEPAEDPQCVLQRLCSGQMLRAQPPIVGRTEEHQVVREVLTQGVRGGSLFIIGPPGTGKSSSVSALLLEQGYQVLEAVTLKRKRVKSDKVAVKLNCSTFTDPAVLFAAVAQHLRQATSWKVPERLDPFAMDQFVATQRGGSKAKRPPLVVVLDEVDQLLRLPARVQPTVKEVLHFFVRWAAVAPRDV
jgi:Cdc6-like AAA superfamily ATPase